MAWEFGNWLEKKKEREIGVEKEGGGTERIEREGEKGSKRREEYTGTGV